MDGGSDTESAPDEEDMGTEVAVAISGSNKIRGNDGNDLKI